MSRNEGPAGSVRLRRRALVMGAGLGLVIVAAASAVAALALARRDLAPAHQVRPGEARATLAAQLARAAAAHRAQDVAAEHASYAAAMETTRRLEVADQPSSWPLLARAYRQAAAAALRAGEPALARRRLERALEVGGRHYVERPRQAAARSLARSHALLAELEEAVASVDPPGSAAAGAAALERSAQQRRFALLLLEQWRLEGDDGDRDGDDRDGEDDDGDDGDDGDRDGDDESLQRELVDALAALGDLEARRQRRGGARGYYERAWATAIRLDAGGASPLRQLWQLIDLRLRRLERLGDEEQCLPLLRQLAPLWWLGGGIQGDGDGSDHRTSRRDGDDAAALERWLAGCPRLGGEGQEAALALADAFEAAQPQRTAELGRLRLALARGLIEAGRGAEAVAQLRRGARLLEDALGEVDDDEAAGVDEGAGSPRDGEARSSAPGAPHRELEARAALLALYALRLELEAMSAPRAARVAARCWRVAAAARWQAQRVDCALAAMARGRGAARSAPLHRLVAELAATTAADDGTPAPRRRRVRHLLALAGALALAPTRPAPCELPRRLLDQAELLLRQTRGEWASRDGSPAPRALAELSERVAQARRQLAVALPRRCR